MSDGRVPYTIFSVFRGEFERPVGVFPGGPDEQPILFNAPIVQWFATPNLIGDQPQVLGVDRFRFTIGRDNVVIATDDSHGRRAAWYLKPANQQDTYLIGEDPDFSRVWTVIEEPLSPVTIQRFNPNVPGSQVFKIKRLE